MSDLILEGQLVDSLWEAPRWGQVEIRGGKIARVGDLGLRPDLKMADHQLVFPGFVDVHVHLRQGDEYKEDFQTATRAALQGGVTCMWDMPNNPVPPRSYDDLQLKRSLVADLPIDIGFYLGVGPGTRPDPRHRHYKAFMGPSIGPLFFHDDQDLAEATQHYAGCRLTLHCEDPVMLRELASQPAHEDQRPPLAEQKAILTALRLGKEHGLRLHVAHLSQPHSLDTLERAQSDFAPDELGLPGVVWESTPHHLFFDRDNRSQFERNAFLKMNPPLRPPAERAALLEAFLAGRIHFLSTDHAPHTVAEKSTSNPSGVPLLDTYGAFACWLLQQGLSPTQLARHACHWPGLFTALPVGRLEPGYHGHLAVLDLQQPWTVRAEDIHSKCAWSPFEGVTLPGRVALTVASGQPFRAGRPL